MADEILDFMYDIKAYIRPEVLEEANAEPEKTFTIQGKDITRLAYQIENLLKLIKVWQNRAKYEANNYQTLINAMLSIYKKEDTK